MACLASSYDLCLLVSAFFITNAITLQKKTPLLTAPLVRKLLCAMLPLRSLSMEGAIEIVEYHLQRNLVAYKSHRKKRVMIAKELKANVSL